MKITIGNKVKFINENLEGEVRAIVSKDRIVVACSDGFDYEVGVDEVIFENDENNFEYYLDDSKIETKIVQQEKHHKENGVLSRYMSLAKYKLERTLEIDLHLEELVEFPGKLDDWQKLHTQLQHVKKCLNAASERNIRKVVFIHGVGTGVLKTELRNLLADYSHIDFKDADFQEYGMGATELYIKY